MQQISWDDRFLGYNGSRCLVSVDGTDFKVNEPRPLNPGFCSHKFKHATVRCEVGVAIQHPSVVWLNGPFPAGTWSDCRIAMNWLDHALLPGEMHVADGGHRDGHQRADTPTGLHNDDDKMKSKVRARHETVNKRFKEWHCLSDCHRHSLEKHGVVMRAVANIVQIEMEEERPLFQLPCKDNWTVTLTALQPCRWFAVEQCCS